MDGSSEPYRCDEGELRLGGPMVVLVAAIGWAGLTPTFCGGGAARAASPHPPAPAAELDQVDAATRRAYIERAQVWRPVRTSSLDLLAGPRVAGAFAFDAAVACEYTEPEKTLGGLTPKFLCRAGDDTFKVKYGDGNGEVYAETAGSRLFWALGFGADAIYPVKVTCRHCPVDPWLWKTTHRVEERTFDVAAIERKLEGDTIESEEAAGWSWKELDLVDPAKGGAPVEHRDALKLLAVLVQHGDNKPAQQRLVCLPGRTRKVRAGLVCDAPFLAVSDLGATFGGAGELSTGGAKMRFREWARKPVFRDPARCEGELDASIFGDLQHPVIGEKGRRFLSARLAQLSDTQLRDLFTAARVERRGETLEEGGRERPVTVSDWVDAFKKKRQEIAAARCPR